MGNERMSWLVVAAWEPELTTFRGLCPDRISAAVGIGLVDAAAGTAQCVIRHAPQRLVFLGTAGASPGSGLGIGDVVVARSVVLTDASAVEGRAALPFLTRLDLDPELVEGFVSAGARAVTVANTLGITTDDHLAGTLAASGEVEHLEAFAVARACALAALPCALVLGIANVVGARGREEWRAHHEEASARAAAVVARAIGATGSL